MAGAERNKAPEGGHRRALRNTAGTALVLLGVWLMGAVPLAAEDIRVIANVESRDVYMGESFLFQITVDGASEAAPPDLSGLTGFMVEYLGGSNNSSQSISIINGRVQRSVKKSFIMTYRLTPETAGRLTIPSLDVNVEGTVFQTNPIPISSKKPEETEEFKLQARLSRPTCFVGEPVVLKVTWYLRKDVQDFQLTAPILSNDAFTFENPEVKIDRSKKYFRVPLGNMEVIAEKGEGILDGLNYATLRFDLVLIPRRAGAFVIPEFIIACEAGYGMRTSRRDFLDDFFSDGLSGRWGGRLKKYVVPSNTLDLEVKALPLAGKPRGFAGHVGEYKIEVTAEPVEVNVGDPITLKIILEGPDYLGGVNLPPLSSQEEITENFKVPPERAAGRIEGKRKIFTQTLRAKHDQVKEIPPIKLVYFDTASEKYLTAASRPIPLTVRPTKVVTASDAEGIDSGQSGAPLEKWKEGIAYNYQGSDLLISQDVGIRSVISSRGIMLLLVLPPPGFFLLFFVRFWRLRRASDPQALKARGARKRFLAALRSLSAKADRNQTEFCTGMMEAFKEYLGDKLRRTAASITRGDVETLLAERGVDQAVVIKVKEILGSCERGAYAGGLGSDQDRDHLIRKAREVAAAIEKSL
ncbi:MAG: BatD family protein [Candidatus Krumholzibacteriota bacterium]|nr:BatD family protein [Candidatus Krumholzibacteriota bacterium]